jgi:hypothetical protein
MSVKHPRKREQEGREKAFVAARLAISENISMQEAANRCGSLRASVQEASMILRLGTPDEIADVEAGRAAMRVTVDAIRERTTEEERKAVARKPTFGVHVQEGREFDAEVWSKLREAIDALTGLPSPNDVATIVKKNVMRTEHVSRKLLPAHSWLEEFANAWTR